MKCKISLEIQGVLSKPAYVFFSKKVKQCRGKIRIFNQETNEYVAIFELKGSSLCEGLHEVFRLSHYCTSIIKLVMILNDNELSNISLKLREMSKWIRLGNNIRYILRANDNYLIGILNKEKKLLTLYPLHSVPRSSPLVETTLTLPMSDILTLSRFECDYDKLRHLYKLMKHLSSVLGCSI